MKSESEGPTKLQEFIRQEGCPYHLHNDNSKMQCGKAWTEICNRYNIKTSSTEPHHPQQNPSERKIKTAKNRVLRLMDHTGTPGCLWLECLTYWAMLLNVLALKKHNWRTPTEVAYGITPDISAFLQYEWFEPVYYYDCNGAAFPNSREKLGRFVGVAENCGDALTYKIYKADTKEIIQRSVVRSARSQQGPRNHRALDVHLQDNVDTEDDTQDIPFIQEAEIEGSEDVEPTQIDPEEAHDERLLSMHDLIESITKEKRSKALPSLDDLRGYTYANEKNGTVQKGTVIDVDEDLENATVEFKDGSRSLVDYNLLTEQYNQSENDADDLYTFSKISGHRQNSKRGKAWEVQVVWDHEEPSWEPLCTMRKDDPVTLAQYAKDNDLLRTPGWKWAKNIIKNPSKMIRLAKIFKNAKAQRTKYKFGVEVARNAKHALELDKENKNDLWKTSIEKEIGQILDYKTFQILQHGEKAPKDHQRITLHLVFDVKHDGRRKARLVAGGHLTAPPEEEVYSSVVAPESVRLLVLLADHNKLTITIIWNPFSLNQSTSSIRSLSNSSIRCSFSVHVFS